MTAAWINLLIAMFFNTSTIYFLKKAEGFTVLWPTLGAFVFIGLAQLFISRAMASGMSAGLAMAVICVAAIVGGAVFGVSLFGETVSLQKGVGIAIAVVGVVVASTA